MIQLDRAYAAQRIKLRHVVAHAISQLVTAGGSPTAGVGAQLVPLVEAGQKQMANLTQAYMGAKAIAATGQRPQVTLDTARYTIAALRGGVDPADVYQRPFTVLSAAAARTADHPAALQSGRAQAVKLAVTDLQLAQTHAARDWMLDANRQIQPVGADVAQARIVGWRRTLTGPGPHCQLCELAATRTYHVSNLMPIHEHCGCGVEPVWDTAPIDVVPVGSPVRVEEDPELGPRLMDEDWAPVGPRLT